MTEWLLLVLAVALVTANALFVAAEFSLVTVDRTRVEAAAQSGDNAARRVDRAVRLLSTQLSGAQLGITVTSLLVGYLAEPSLAALLREPLSSVGVPERAVPAVAFAVAFGAANAFQMVFGELVPKNLAISRPWEVARAVAPPQLAFVAVTGPLVRFLNGNANRILRRMGFEPQEELASARTAEELRSLVRRSAVVGTLSGSTASLLDRSLRFGRRTAADAMTPRVRVVSVAADAPVADVLRLSRRTGLSRFPVTGTDGIDEVVGVVGVRRVLRVPRDERDSVPVERIAQQPLPVPETLELDSLLERMQDADVHLAVVFDEYGGTAGVITMEDLIEELVGEVQDEHDVAAPRTRRQPDGTLLASGLLRPDELRDLGVPIPERQHYETVAGFVVDELGRIPQVGDEVTVDGWRVVVERLDGRRVDRLRIIPPDGQEW